MMKHYKENSGQWKGVLGIAQEAQSMINEDSKSVRDEGTCVLGAGIAVYVVPKRCRNAQMRVLTRAGFQGNCSQYKASKRALEYMKSMGVDAFWYDGMMD